MERILCDFQIGNLYQNVFVKKENKKVEKFSLKLKDIPDFINKEGINAVFIKGSPTYGEIVERKLPKNKFTFFYMDRKR